MKDLITGDSAKAQLKLTEEILSETEKKISIKDSVIVTLKMKESNYLTIIDGEKQKFQIQESYTKNLERDLKRERVKNKFKSILGTGIIAAMGFFLITK